MTSTLALPHSAMNKIALPPTAGNGPSSSGLALPTTSNSNATAGPSRLSTLVTTPLVTKVELPLKSVVAGQDSPVAEDDDEEDEDGDEGDDAGGRKKGSGAGAGKKKKPGSITEGKEYKYTSEISQMMFVFGEVQDPLPETVKLVEDVVKGQIIEIVTRARLLTHLRSSRYLSSEDLIFLIREDRSKVNRLRTYLSWKDVRKRAKDDDVGAGGAPDTGEVDLDDNVDKNLAKGRKSMVKLPWELLTPFGDFLKTLPNKGGGEDDEEEDDDELQAHQDSMQRLRDADEITKKMTKDEYVHYSDCRQASFTYRKARRFRDFVNFSAYLDVRPNDDIVDILGFLAFEMVRSLCVTALDVRDRMDKTHSPSTISNTTISGGLARRGTISTTTTTITSPAKRKLGSVDSSSPIKKQKVDEASSENEINTAQTKRSSGYPISLFAPPPSARSPLLPAHVLEAFAQIQRQQAATRGSAMRNFRGGVSRGRVALV